MDEPKEISMDLVNAQQARRALDYLVGFNLSPLLWKKIKPGLSAGRVQSPALRLICEREEEIEKFKPVEYWTIHANIIFDKSAFESELREYQGKKLKKFDLSNSNEAEAVVELLQKKSNGQFKVKVLKKAKEENPAPTFHHINYATRVDKVDLQPKNHENSPTIIRRNIYRFRDRGPFI